MSDVTAGVTASSPMSEFIITFSRLGIRKGYVRVMAYDEAIARAWARREYDECWSGIYPIAEFIPRPEYWPLGELDSTTLHYEKAEHIR